MICDERDIRCSELRKIFREYIIMDEDCNYLEAKLREDAPEKVKSAHKEYIKLRKQIRKDRENLPFI